MPPTMRRDLPVSMMQLHTSGRTSAPTWLGCGPIGGGDGVGSKKPPDEKPPCSTRNRGSGGRGEKKGAKRERDEGRYLLCRVKHWVTPDIVLARQRGVDKGQGAAGPGEVEGVALGPILTGAVHHGDRLRCLREHGEEVPCRPWAVQVHLEGGAQRGEHKGGENIGKNKADHRHEKIRPRPRDYILY